VIVYKFQGHVELHREYQSIFASRKCAKVFPAHLPHYFRVLVRVVHVLLPYCRQRILDFNGILFRALKHHESADSFGVCFGDGPNGATCEAMLSIIFCFEYF